ncbi:phenylacetate--CoA ligase family protein [Mycobacterium sp. CVI_P3]|uniref:Phenylacetate--CoA ligase family protein n=1 Tax=Mycobacterium pinniadriaticum TaxID=2994102 RepID=A0ABT3SNA6_9MYCO|nr:phenylacetate--CoA ligase family protein [Mycobacterium pinniadriaticum]MCX2934602.1 phenylacetate--CoA ligase family protein [Mycobacterium pinniadriaticum]MCX2940996.1 phenylacetate--CoA ligase family protein [Mycobacterium pinniadriaticum]
MRRGERRKVERDIWRAKWATEDSIRARQERRLSDLLSFAREHSRFYRDLYADLPDELEALPVVTKPMLMANFDDVVTDPAVSWSGVSDFLAEGTNIGRRHLGRYPVWTTSGTTGEPGVFVQDDLSLILVGTVPDRWTTPALLNPRMLARLIRNNLRGAEIAVTGGHFAGASGFELIRRESRFLRERLRMFSPGQPIDDVVAGLNAFRPAFITGYSTVLVELGRAQRDGRLAITPAMIAASGEPISVDAKRALRDVFGCVVREMYGATEAVPLAVECHRGSLHLNADWFVLEPVDKTHSPVRPGQIGDTVLLTHLGNRIQPLIRYDLGDSVGLHTDRCSCGSAFPVLEIRGRQGEVLWFTDADGRQVPLFPLALTTVVEGVPGVRRCQIIRIGPSTVEIRFDVLADADRETTWPLIRAALLRFFASQAIPGVAIEQGAQPPRRHQRSGKFRHVWTATTGLT